MFKDMLKSNESLFTNEIALDIDYTPPIIKYRESEQAYVAECIQPLFKGRNGKNLLISGEPGIGKTVAVRHIFNELGKETNDIIPVYINCWKMETFYKIVVELCKQLGYRFIQNKRGDELFREVARIINKKTIVLCLDEADKLNELSILYSILEDIYKRTIILITNDETWLASLDQRIRSRLVPELLEFRPYNRDEVYGILKERKDYAFVNNIWEDDAFNIIAEKTFNTNDVRVGLFLLREAGTIAENASSVRIRLQDAESAISKLGDFKMKSPAFLNDDEKDIISLVGGNAGADSSYIYKLYSKKYDRSYRTFQRKVYKLSEGGLISIKEITTKTGLITYQLNPAIKKLSDF